ncbi:MAG: hypothetical protein WCA21_01955 [Terracidiphilus sp.]
MLSSLTISGEGREMRTRMATIPLNTKSGLTRSVILILWYLCTSKEFMAKESQVTSLVEVERVQTGVRMEKRLLKVLKAVAELKDMTLGDLLEGIVLHALENKTPFSEKTLKEIEHFSAIYGMTLKATDSHKLKERKK